MEFEVVVDTGTPAEGHSEVEEPTQEVAPKRSARRSLREIRQRIVDDLHIDLKVPRLSIEDEDGTFDVFVRYGPVRSAKVDASLKRRSEQTHNENEASLLVHVDILVDSCRGVYYVLDGDMDSKYSFKLLEDGEQDPEPTQYWTKFDRDLGASLGMTEFEAKLAENVCRKLYLTDGDLIDASTKLSTWSAQANEEAEKDFSQP